MNIKIRIIFVLIILLIISTLGLYKFDKDINPAVVSMADALIKKKTIEIIDKQILNEYSNFNYDNVVKVERDNSGDISLVKADTLKMNKIACDITIKAQDELNKEGSINVNIPMVYILKNNLLANFGPNISIKAKPIGNISTEYVSKFESEGINQTRHSIYINVETYVEVVYPISIQKIKVKTQIPVAETIILGKVPNTALQFDLKNAGVSIPNKKENQLK
ncbi:MAG: sporulation protein YunB [Clostridium sp.]|nr:sporulation protein YunB [Clostridium sp.]